MITVIVPAYNAANTLPLCLVALQKQTYPPDEIIVVNDGSIDETAKVAGAFKVKVINQSHQGPAVARNLGLSNAHNDIVLFTDADCEPISTWAAEMLAPFSDPRVVGVKGSYRTHQKENIARLVQYEFEDRYDRLERQETIDFIDTYAAAFKRTVLNKMGGFDPAFPRAVSEDAELSYRLSRAGCRMIFNRDAVVYHCHPRTWKTYIRRKIKFSYWRMMAYRLHPAKVLQDSYTPQLLKVQLALVYLLLGFAGLAICDPAFLIGAVVSLGLLLISAIPFSRRVVQHENSLFIASLAFILVRTLAFSIGVAGGMIGMLFFQSQISTKR
jgi:glycosyltransferase involved in cell wall biosynthesis